MTQPASSTSPGSTSLGTMTFSRPSDTPTTEPFSMSTRSAAQLRRTSPPWRVTAPARSRHMPSQPWPGQHE